jgi:TrmH family RNA methyltransferase
MKLERNMLVKSKVKYIQSLGQKKFREQEGVFIAEGTKLVNELLLSDNAEILEVFALQEWMGENKKLLGSISVTEITAADLEKISQLTTPNQVLAIVKEFKINDKIETNGQIILALDGIRDPGNMGTIIRIADWFGVKQIICSNDCADMYKTKVVQATMGSIARIKIFYTDLEKWLSENAKTNVYATVLNGEDIASAKKVKEGVILIGNESKGISLAILKLATNKITIPRKGNAESLNAAVAAGIVLSHLIQSINTK